jgi:DNA-binding transcriptional ArsR family regulator
MACIGDPSRFALLRNLARGPACVTELARRVGLSQSCTTRHLQALSRESLVKGVRDGKKVVFAMRDDDPVASRLRDLALADAGDGEDMEALRTHPRRRSGAARSAPPTRRPRIETQRPNGVDEVETHDPGRPDTPGEPYRRPPNRSDIEDYLL